jgi:N6-L-threonylcarbamoyladenine synthase
MHPAILAIESSCDETAASIIVDGKVLNNIVATQFVHKNYGGVVPELASREHQKNIVPIVDEALKKAAINISDLDAVAFTQGPGLLGSLLVGASFAKSIAMVNSIPLISVHHMQAHILSHFIDKPHPAFPFLCLTISGGHTQIILVIDYLIMKVLGETRDDAVGEAFDKGAKILGLPYPGGPLIDKYSKKGDENFVDFPVTELAGLDFSFSGIKTSLLYYLRDQQKKNRNFINDHLNDICASYQKALVKMLLIKLEQASKETGIKELAIAGGVSVNSFLRNSLDEKSKEMNWNVHYPKFEYCTDNAAMVAMTAHYKYINNQFEKADVKVDPRLKFPENEINF